MGQFCFELMRDTKPPILSHSPSSFDSSEKPPKPLPQGAISQLEQSLPTIVTKIIEI
jgi:hypothetical protein